MPGCKKAKSQKTLIFYIAYNENKSINIEFSLPVFKGFTAL